MLNASQPRFPPADLVQVAAVAQHGAQLDVQIAQSALCTKPFPERQTVRETVNVSPHHTAARTLMIVGGSLLGAAAVGLVCRTDNPEGGKQSCLSVFEPLLLLSGTGLLVAGVTVASAGDASRREKSRVYQRTVELPPPLPGCTVAGALVELELDSGKMLGARTDVDGHARFDLPASLAGPIGCRIFVNGSAKKEVVLRFLSGSP